MKVFTSPKLPEIRISHEFETDNLSSRDLPDKPMFKLDLRIPKISEFIWKLQEQVQRVSPNFVFDYEPSPPLTQALAMFQEAVDKFLEGYSKAKNSLENSKIEESDLGNDHVQTKKAEETMKTLCRYERLLKQKEAQVNVEKARLEELAENLKIIEENLKETKEILEIDKNCWLESKNMAFGKIEEDRQKLEIEKKNLENIIEDIKNMQEKIDKKNAEMAKSLHAQEQNIKEMQNSITKANEEFSKEKLEFSHQKNICMQEKWKLDQLKHSCEEKEALFALKIEHFNLEKSEFENEKSRLKTMKSNLDEEEKALFLEKKLFNKRKAQNFDSNSSEDFEYNSTSQNSMYYERESQKLTEREYEIELAYIELTEQMEKFNQELEDRENLSAVKEDRLSAKEKELLKKFEEFQMIESCLIESKHEIENFRLAVVPDLEKQSEILEGLIQELLEKKKILENLTQKLRKEVHSLQAIKSNLEVIKESPHEISSDESPELENCFDNFDLITKKIMQYNCKKDEEEKKPELEKSSSPDLTQRKRAIRYKSKEAFSLKKVEVPDEVDTSSSSLIVNCN